MHIEIHSYVYSKPKIKCEHKTTNGDNTTDKTVDQTTLKGQDLESQLSGAMSQVDDLDLELERSVRKKTGTNTRSGNYCTGLHLNISYKLQICIMVFFRISSAT